MEIINISCLLNCAVNSFVLAVNMNSMKAAKKHDSTICDGDIRCHTSDARIGADKDTSKGSVIGSAIASSEDRLLTYAATASVVVALGLILLKGYAYWVSGSVSLLASLVDSFIDSLASVLNFVAVRYALKPADDRHRFGHGKAESLAGLGQSIFIMVSALFLMFQAYGRWANPQPLQQLDIALLVMFVSILATFSLVIFQKRVISKTGSVAIKADSLHYLSDLLTNLGVVIALVLASYGLPLADPVLAMLIAVYIFYTAISIGGESIQHLLDRELPKADQNTIAQIALQHQDVLGVHELRTRQAGRTKIIQLHLELDKNLPLWRAHRICDDVERAIRKHYPRSDVLIHQDPYSAPSEDG